jgi:radical SAM superfamily enzyme YgiQ (UPF0313 family)
MPHVVLLSTYELGRQPFGLASPAAWLPDAGAEVALQDLAVSSLDPEPIRDALLVGIYVPMHTATRLAEGVLRRVRELNPTVHVCVYGLYAPMNARHLRSLGANTVIGGEFEEPLAALYKDLSTAPAARVSDPPTISLSRQQFRVPDRSGLPSLQRYGGLTIDGRRKVVGYTEATRGCKHLCRHCPIVPVYGGRFRAVQLATVLEDIRQQVAAGAEHITFGDPDFLNAPAHSMRIVERMHEEFPHITYDATIKVEHLCRHADLVPHLKRTGCVLITSAIESVDESILERLDKRHTLADLERVIEVLRAADVFLNPTLVAFTPWTTLTGYAQLLTTVLRLQLVDLISPVQYSIRLLIPAGSRLLELSEVQGLVGMFDPNALAYPWQNSDTRVDKLHREVVGLVQECHRDGLDRRATFRRLWDTAFRALGAAAPPCDTGALTDRGPIPYSSEAWYCCAEPTDDQLASI